MIDMISEKVDEIIAQRKPLIQKIDTVSLHLGKLKSGLMNYKRNSPETGQIQGFLPEVDEINRDLLHLRQRFSRETLNIGIVGRMRQGKSQIVQSISGLDDRSIPTSSRMATTGARSTIQNYPDGTTYAEVFFYTEQEFITDVLTPYFDELKLDQVPQTLSEFSTMVLPDELFSNLDHANKFNRLREYHANLEAYQGHLRSTGHLRISEAEIPKYVAQFNPANPEDKYTDYMAVKQVKIYASFPNTSVHNIALVDMPGLGEITVGDDRRMIQALNEEADMVLFLRMPKATGDDWQQEDVNLYDNAAKALPGIALKDWSFQVLNRLSDGSNSQNCQDFYEQMAVRGIEVAETRTTDASNPEAVSVDILHPLLDYMANHLSRIDQQHAQNLQDQIDNLCTKISSLMGATGNQASSERLFNELFHSSKNRMSRELKDMVDELKEVRDQEDENLKNSLEEAVNNCRENKGLPDNEAVKSIASLNYMSGAYNHFKDEMRTRLVENFSRLDEGVNQSVLETKDRICHVFKDAGFQFISTDGTNFLSRFLERIQHDESFVTIASAVHNLNDFKLSYRGLIQHRIRKHLDSLYGDSREFKLPPESEEKDVIERLEYAYDKVLYNIENEVIGLLWEPCMACFAIAEEFCDRILHSENIMELEWRNFMYEHKEFIWPDEFADMTLRTSIQSLARAQDLRLVA